MARTQLNAVIMLVLLLVGSRLTLAQVAPVTQPPAPIDFPNWKEVDRSEATVEYSVAFPSAMLTKYPANNVVPLRVLVPASASGPMPVVIVLHYWGTRDLKVERALGGELNRHRIAAVLVTLPYHLSRTPPGFQSGELALDPSVDQLIATTTQSVWDVRRTIDWILTRSEFDKTRIGVAGASLGAEVAALAFGIDDRFAAATFILGGADIAHILWNSSRTVRQRDVWRRQGLTEGRLRTELEAIEPTPYLEHRPKAPSFVIGANFDTVVPRRATTELLEVLPGAKSLFVDTGHYGGVFVERRLLREVGNFFNAVFTGRDFTPPSRIYAPTVRIGGIANTATGFDLAAGLDLFKLDHRGEGFASILITPRGPGFFLGRRIDSRISIGGFAVRKNIGIGLFWSTVL